MFYTLESFRKICPSQRQIEIWDTFIKYQSERKQKRYARFKAQVEQVWKQYPIFKETWSILLLLIFTSCAQTKYVMPNDTLTTTTTTTKTIQRDSIYLHDSIYVREYIQGDTVFRDKLVEHFKDRWLTRIDTLLQHDTTTITQTITQTIKEPVRYVPNFYKWCLAILILIFIIIIAKFTIKLYRKKRNFH